MTFSPPMRPAIRLPLNTRAGVAHWPDGARAHGARGGRRGWRVWPEKPWRFITPAKPLPLLTAVTSIALAVGEDVDLELLADLVAGDVVEAQLDEAHARLDAGLGELAGDRLGELGGLLLAEGDLQGAVAVALGGLDLHDPAGLDLQHGDRDDAVLRRPRPGSCRPSRRRLPWLPSASRSLSRGGTAGAVHADAPLGRARRSVGSVVLRGTCEQADADVDCGGTSARTSGPQGTKGRW